MDKVLAESCIEALECAPVSVHVVEQGCRMPTRCPENACNPGSLSSNFIHLVCRRQCILTSDDSSDHVEERMKSVEDQY